MSNVVHRSIRKTALPRTGRTLDAVPSSATGSGSGSGAAGSSGSGVKDHSQLTGVISTIDEYKDSAKDIHLTATDADALKRLSTLEIIESTDTTTLPTDSNLYSAAKSKLEDEKIIQEVEGKFISKIKPDETDYRVDFKDGITTGEYVGGLLGDGSIIDKDGNGEMNSLKLREFLEVPELRFNRIDVVSGELWNSIAFGLIESVDEVNQIAKLKLEEGELSGIHVNDFCRGIFHNLIGNDTSPGKDDSGFDVMVGFRTSYFTPVEIIDNVTFKYELKPGSTVHPCKAMKFAVYGNPIDKDRQASAYHTRTYTRYLRGVNTWKIEEKHISMQLGDLSSLIIGGAQLGEGSVYLNNVYFGGNVWHVPGADDTLKGNDAYSVTLSTYSAVYNVADGIYGEVDVVSGDKKVVTGANSVIATEFNVSTLIQVTKGAGMLRYSETIGDGKYVVTSFGTGCVYSITDGMIVVREVTENKAEVRLEVNCEGMSVYEVSFTIVRVADGSDGKDYEYIYTRTEKEQRPATPATGQTDDFIPSGWTDDPVGPTLTIPFEWISKRVKVAGVWGNFSTPALWAKFGEDGKEHEYIYSRTSTNNAPSTPPTSQVDDYVPEGWTDDPVGVDLNYMYEWVSKRSKTKEKWGSFSTPALWSKFGKDGIDGKDGKDFEFIFCRTATESRPVTPGTSQTDDYVPSGWTDDAVGPVGSLPYEWACKRIKVNGVWGMFSTPSLWSRYSFDGEDGNDGQDGKGIEFIFKRQNTVTAPVTPLGENRDDFVPAGWSDDQQGVTGSLQYEFVSKRVKVNGIWSVYSTPALWAKFSFDGEDGQDGMDGVPGTPGKDGITYYTWIRYADTASGSGISNSPNGKKYIGFAYNKTTPVESNTPSNYTWSKIQGEDGTDGVPGPPGKDGQTTYTWVAYSDYSDGRYMYQIPNDNTKYIGIAVNKTTATESNTPSDYTWSKFRGTDGQNGQPGEPGKDGQYVEQRYKRSKDQPEMQMTVVSPPGWSLTPPQGELPLWMSKATFNADGTIPNEGYWTWSYPVRISGDAGAPGTAGERGPAITFRGEYSSLIQYVGNSNRVDVVKHEYMGEYRYFIAKATAGAIPIGTLPTDTSKWTVLEGQFESIATGLLIAEQANISGWRFRNNYIESQNENVVLDGNADTHPRIALGSTYADRDNAPTRMYDNGDVYFQKGVFGGYLQMKFVDLTLSDAIVVPSGGSREMYRLNKNLNVVGYDNDGVILPAALSYEGAVATIYNCNFPPYTKSFYATLIETENGYGIGGINRNHNNWSESNDPIDMYLGGEVIQFLAVKASVYDYTTDSYDYYIKWIALNYK